VAKKKAGEPVVAVPDGMVVLMSPHPGPFQVGTAEDPREVDADGRIVLDPEKDAELIMQLTDPRIGFVKDLS